jgi:hypothetical protein
MIEGNMDQPAADMIIEYGSSGLDGEYDVLGAYLSSGYADGIWGDSASATIVGEEAAIVDEEATVNGEDFTILANNWGSQPVSIPEPASVCLLGVGAIGILGRRRRHHSA